eukprot:COSAG06_NODE_2388_length_6965_cov_6.706379_7_plen_42_part_01
MRAVTVEALSRTRAGPGRGTVRSASVYRLSIRSAHLSRLSIR